MLPIEDTTAYLPTGVEAEEVNMIRPGDTLITGSADQTARSWSFDTGGCLKVSRE